AHAAALREWVAAPLGTTAARAEFERVWTAPELVALRAELQRQIDEARHQAGERPPAASGDALAAMRDWSAWRLELARAAAAPSRMDEQELSRMAAVLLPGVVLADSATASSAAGARLLTDLMSVVAARYPQWQADPAARQLAGRMWQEFSALCREVEFPASLALDRALASRWAEAYSLASDDITRASAEPRTWDAVLRTIGAVLGASGASLSARMVTAMHGVEADDWLLTYGDDVAREDGFEHWWDKPFLVEMRAAWAVVLPFAPVPVLRVFHEVFPDWQSLLAETFEAAPPVTAEQAQWLARAAHEMARPAPMAGSPAVQQMRLRRSLIDRLAYHLAVHAAAQASGRTDRVAAENIEIETLRIGKLALMRASFELSAQLAQLRDVRAELAAWEKQTVQADQARVVPRLVLPMLSHPSWAPLRNRLIDELAGYTHGSYSPAEERLLDEVAGVLAAAEQQEIFTPAETTEAVQNFVERFVALRRTGDVPHQVARRLMEQTARGLHEMAGRTGRPSPFPVSGDFLPEEPPQNRPALTADDEDRIERVQARLAGEISRMQIWLGTLSAEQIDGQLRAAQTVFGSIEGLQGVSQAFAETVLLVHMYQFAEARRSGYSGWARAYFLERTWARSRLTELRTVAGTVLGPELAATPLAIETSRWKWREVIESARAEAPEAAAQWRRDAALALRPLLGVLGEGPETAVQARARALYEELVEAVAAATWQLDERPGWEWSRDLAQWAKRLAVQFEKLSAAGAFKTAGDLRVRRFRRRFAAVFRDRFGTRPPAPGTGVTEEMVRRRWIERGVQLLGQQTFEDRRGEELRHLEELALVVGRHDAAVATVRARAEAAARDWISAGRNAQPGGWQLERAAHRLAGRMLGDAGRKGTDAASLEQVATEVRTTRAAAEWLARVGGPSGDGAEFAKQVELARKKLWPADLAAAVYPGADLAKKGHAEDDPEPRPEQRAQWLAEGKQLLGDPGFSRIVTPWRYWLAERLDDPAAADWLLTALAEQPWTLNEAEAALEATSSVEPGTSLSTDQLESWKRIGQRLAGGGLDPGASLLAGYRATHYLSSTRLDGAIAQFSRAIEQLRRGRFDPPPVRAISALDPDMDRHLADFNDSYRWETTIWDLGEVDTLWDLGEGESDDDSDSDSDSSDGSDSLAGSGSSDDARSVSGPASGPGSGPGHSAGPASPRPSSPGSSDAG
ncbi:hypothetical protein ABT279_43060, partial [Amycolatopsis sp. NPDC000673]